VGYGGEFEVFGKGFHGESDQGSVTRDQESGLSVRKRFS